MSNPSCPQHSVLEWSPRFFGSQGAPDHIPILKFPLDIHKHSHSVLTIPPKIQLNSCRVTVAGGRRNTEKVRKHDLLVKGEKLQLSHQRAPENRFQDGRLPFPTCAQWCQVLPRTKGPRTWDGNSSCSRGFLLPVLTAANHLGKGRCQRPASEVPIHTSMQQRSSQPAEWWGSNSHCGVHSARQKLLAGKNIDHGHWPNVCKDLIPYFS